MDMEALVQVGRTPPVGTLTLNRPASRNALSAAMIAALRDSVGALESDSGIRVIVLRAAGPAFCAGHDLAEMTAWRAEADGGRGRFRELFRQCSKLMTAIVRCPLPVVAEVDGAAVAAGCQLVASCDLAFASERARFATPGVRIGLFCSTPMVALSRSVSRKHAMEMLLTGDAVDAGRAVQLGLVNREIASGRLRAETERFAVEIASRSPAAIRHGKRAFYEQLELGLDDAYAAMGSVMTENMLAADAGEGIGAFLEKRAPRWPNRAERF